MFDGVDLLKSINYPNMPSNRIKILFGIFALLCFKANSQLSADQFIYSSCGDIGPISGNQFISWTIGEVVVESSISNFHFTQGFHQPGHICNLIFNLPDLSFCGVDSVVLDAGEHFNYMWNNGDTTQSIVATSNGLYSIEISDSIGCSAVDSFQLMLHDLPIITSTINQYFDGSGGDVELSVFGNAPFLFDWDIDGNGDFDDFSDQFNLSPGTYQVIVMDDNDCKDTIDVFIDNEIFIFIPTGISPNSDGVNDTWEIQGISSAENYSVKILNRWGNTLYSSSNEYTPWDGIYNGSRVPTSDYYYIIELYSLNKVYTGTLTVRY